MKMKIFTRFKLLKYEQLKGSLEVDEIETDNILETKLSLDDVLSMEVSLIEPIIYKINMFDTNRYVQL
jgi:hypothetical protein